MDKRHSQEKVSESFLDQVKHDYKQAMPEALGGGYPVQAGIIKDDQPKSDVQTKPVLEQIKDQVMSIIDPTKDIAAKIAAPPNKAKIPRDGAGDISSFRTQAKGKGKFYEAPRTMTNKPLHITPSESLQIEPPSDQTMSEALEGYPVQAGIIKDENGNIIRPGAESKKESNQSSESLLDQVKHAYKQTMPEGLGGGYPVQAGIIKDGEKAKTILHPKGDQSKEKRKPDVGHTKKKTEVADVHKAADQARSHVEQATEEVQIAIAKAKPLLEEAMKQAKPHLQQAVAHVKAAGEEGKPFLDETVAEVKKVAAGYMEQIVEQLSEANTTGEKDSLEKVKTQAKEAIKSHLESAPADSEKSDGHKIQGKEAQSNKPFLERAKVAYRENMPEILGGRPSSIPEVVKAGLEREVRAEKEYKEAKEFEELPSEQQSIVDKVKHGYKETMPSVLGGRPTAVSEVVNNKVDNIKKDAHEEVDNLKSSYEQGNLEDHVKERAKEVVEKHMPESLGGRPPTLGEKVKKEIGKAIVKNRVSAMIKGTKEEIENRS